MLAIFMTVAVLTAQTPAALRVTAPATPILPGSVVLLTVEGADATTPVRARAFNRELVAFSRREGQWQVLVGVDLEVKPGTYPVSIVAGTQRTAFPLAVKPRHFLTRTLKVDPNLVNPPARELERIAREAERLRRLWEAPATDQEWQGPFTRPVSDPANSSFGTRSVYNGESRSPHGGTDFLSPSGRPVASPNSGRVVLAGSLYFTGGTVVIDHGRGVLSLFAHLSTIAVHEGDAVKTGDVVGEVGATGRVTGPHLHWAVRVGGARVDPLLLLAALGAG